MDDKYKNLIFKSDKIIECSYKLTAVEKKIIEIVLMKHKKDKRYCVLNLQGFINLFKLNHRCAKYDLINIIEDLQKKMIKIEIDGTLISLPWFGSVIIDDNKVIFEITNTMRNLIYGFKNSFTITKISNILKLNRFVSIRLYEICKKYEKLGKFKYELNKLKKILGIEKKYKNINNFKRRCLVPAMKEINEKTDLQISTKDVKDGRNIIGFEIKIKGKRNKIICEN